MATKRVQGLALRFPVQSVNEDFITTLEKLCKKNSGNAALRMYLKDDHESIQTELLARIIRIKPSNTFIKDLKKLAEVGVVTDKLEVRWLSEIAAKVQQPLNSELGTISSSFVLDTIES